MLLMFNSDVVVLQGLTFYSCVCLCEHACDPYAGSNKIIIYLYYSSQHYERKIVFSYKIVAGRHMHDTNH